MKEKEMILKLSDEETVSVDCLKENWVETCFIIMRRKEITLQLLFENLVAITNEIAINDENEQIYDFTLNFATRDLKDCTCMTVSPSAKWLCSKKDQLEEKYDKFIKLPTIAISFHVIDLGESDGESILFVKEFGVK